MPSTGGSRILDGFQPACDATAVRRLRDAGAIVVGKTNLDEFGMGSTTEGCGFQVHGSVSGRDFRSKMQTEHTELLQSPWLIELGAFHLNCDSSDIDEPAGFFKNEFFKNFSCDLTATQPIMTMAISETMKYDYSLTCPICLDTIFNPYALSCGHLSCKGCSCGDASVYIFQGVRSAPPEAKCPVCREVGVFAHAVHMNELDLLIKTR
ncbi:hypothetical protein ZWY2020_014534 [Hordeum vulgare]|nr:hypothetical protein ZWY2020_014534 [Hordeum vulgare]